MGSCGSRIRYDYKASLCILVLWHIPGSRGGDKGSGPPFNFHKFFLVFF